MQVIFINGPKDGLRVTIEDPPRVYRWYVPPRNVKSYKNGCAPVAPLEEDIYDRKDELMCVEGIRVVYIYRGRV